MQTPYNFYGGLQDNGSWGGPSQVWESRGIRNVHFSRIGSGDGFATMSDFSDARYGYSMSQGGNLRRFDSLTGERKDIEPVGPEGVELRYAWNAAINVDPFDSVTIYFGSQFVHKSGDRGNTWETISPDLTTNDPEKQKQAESGGLTFDVTGAENHTTILTIAPSPVERGVIWVGTDDGNVQVTRDDGGTWSNVVDRIRGVPDNTWVPHIEPSKFDGGTAFVVFDDHRRANWTTYVYKTTDYGRSWTSLATDQIWGFVHVIEQDPVDPDLLFLGTEFGLFFSADGGRNWAKWTNGVPTAPVRALMVHPREHDLVIATHGRAVYILDDVRPLRGLTPEVLAGPLHLFAMPTAQQYRVNEAPGYRAFGDAMFLGENRPYGALLTYVANPESDSVRADVEVLDGDDVIRTFNTWAKKGVNRFTWNLRRDGVAPIDQQPDRPLPPGPEVLPGTYTIRLSMGDATSQQTIEVLADPRIQVSRADREAKYAMLGELGAQTEVANEAIRRIRSTREGIETVKGLLEDKDDDASEALSLAADSLDATLEELSGGFIDESEAQGITRGADTALSSVRSAYFSLQSSWDAPTAAQRTLAERARRALDEQVQRFNEVFSTDVAAFRQRVGAAGLELLEVGEPLSVLQ
jgi:hypothetical protein